MLMMKKLKKSKKQENHELRMQIIKRNLGWLLRTFRENMNFSQQEMADSLGWSLMLEKRFENGTAAYTVKQVNDVLHVTGFDYGVISKICKLADVSVAQKLKQK